VVGGVRVERQGSIAVLRLDKARGNAIDEALVEAIRRATAEIAADASVRGVLLASAHPKLFCPGFDLVSLLEYDRPGMERFVERFLEATIALYALRQPVVAAIGGAAVAGGCILALTADHRALRRGSAIGLNEVRVGLPLPWPVAVLLRECVPRAALTRVALLGQNLTDEDAVGAGLAHELLEAEGFEATCLERLRELAEKDTVALGTTKAYLREAAIAEMSAGGPARRAEFLDAWFAPTAQRLIRQTVETLARK
jgi:enoyl-CoA hydratase